MRIDAIRQQIATWQAQGAIDDVEMSAIAPLLYSASFVSLIPVAYSKFPSWLGGGPKQHWNDWVLTVADPKPFLWNWRCENPDGRNVGVSMPSI